jgi:hypothetical protein
MGHPSTRDCRGAHGCPAPTTSCVTVTHTADGRPHLIAIRPLHTGRPVGIPVCAEHLHAAVDTWLLAAMPEARR